MRNVSGMLTKLVFRLVLVAAAGAVAVGISWAVASAAVSDVLGEPPPNMGKQTTTLYWKGAPTLKDHPRAWLFAYSGTRIPGTPTVRIFVSPLGKLLQVDPPNLQARMKGMRRDF